MILEGNEGDNRVNPFFSTPDNSETDAQLWFNISNDLQDLSEILYVSNSNADEQKPDEESSEDEAVDSGSLSNFVLCVFAIIAKHGTSDSEATDWVKLIQAVRPQIVVPSFRSMKKKFHLTEEGKSCEKMWIWFPMAIRFCGRVVIRDHETLEVYKEI